MLFKNTKCSSYSVIRRKNLQISDSKLKRGFFNRDAKEFDEAMIGCFLFRPNKLISLCDQKLG